MPLSPVRTIRCRWPVDWTAGEPGVRARDGPGRSELARPKEPSAAIHMELGQSTVLGLAIVGDDGGVGEADFQKVRGQAPGRATRPSLSALPPLTASAVWHVRSWRKRRQKRPGRRAPTRTWRRWAWRARRARCVRARCAPLPCVARPGAHAHWPLAPQPAFQALTTLLLEAAKFNAVESELTCARHLALSASSRGRAQHARRVLSERRIC